MDFEAIRVGQGIALAATSGGALVSLPLLTDGATAPRFVRVCAKANAFIRFENGGSANVTVTDAMLAPNYPEIYATSGARCISAKSESGATTTLSVVAIEA